MTLAPILRIMSFNYCTLGKGKHQGKNWQILGQDMAEKLLKSIAEKEDVELSDEE